MDISTIPANDLKYVKAHQDIVEILCQSSPIDLISTPCWVTSVICEVEQPDGDPGKWLNKAMVSLNIDDEVSPLKIANILTGIFHLAIAVAQQLGIPPQVLVMAFKETMEANAHE